MRIPRIANRRAALEQDHQEGGRRFRDQFAKRALPPHLGAYAGHAFTPEGKPIAAHEFEARKYDWIPSPDDRAYVKSLMQRVVAPGKMAGWIAAPDRGINNLPMEYEYVRLYSVPVCGQ